MTKSAPIAVAVALLLGGTSLAWQKTEGRQGRIAIRPIPPSTRLRHRARGELFHLIHLKRRARRTRTIACPTSITTIPIRIMAYSTSMPCRLTFRVTPTVT
jgi:hypothetical protein